MEKRLLAVAILVLNFSLTVYGNAEGDALIAFKSSLNDPDGVLTSWDSSLVNPCTWLHITCNSVNSVVRIDLGNANLSGRLVPQLGLLPNLQYIELFNNHITGKIPAVLGNLRYLVSLDLYHNDLSGPIPASLGKLARIRFLRLNNNKLSGPIPKSLTKDFSLQVLDLSSNNLSGIIPVNGAFSHFTPMSFQNNPHLKYPKRFPSKNLPKSPGVSDGATEH